jgi:hypothetical protein
MPVSPPPVSSSYPATPPDDDSKYTILAALQPLFHPSASPNERTIAAVVKTLARYIGPGPVPLRNQDLEILLAVSLLLGPRGRKPRSSW